MRTAAVTDTFNTLVNEAINIDIKLYELQQELRDDLRAKTPNIITVRALPTFNRNPQKNGAARRGDQRGNYYKPNTGRRIYNNTNSGYYRAEAIDLSNINKGPRRWNEKKQGSNRKHNKSLVTYYRCGKQGHFARDCRLKNKVVRQLNVLTHDDPNDAEWEVVTYSVG